MASNQANMLKYSNTPGVFNLQYLNDKDGTAGEK
jgi:hypothetical protein